MLKSPQLLERTEPWLLLAVPSWQSRLDFGLRFSPYGVKSKYAGSTVRTASGGAADSTPGPLRAGEYYAYLSCSGARLEPVWNHIWIQTPALFHANYETVQTPFNLSFS